MRMNTSKLKDRQASVAKQFRVDDTMSWDDIRYVAGFDVAYVGEKAICAAAVFDVKTMKLVERTHIVTEAPMNYVPGFLAFREGPAICQAYYDLEYEPDVLLVDGHGIAHPGRCGSATFVGVELAKPVVGVAKRLLVGDEDGENISLDGEVVGRVVRTKEHAKPLFVSPGNLVPPELAAEVVLKMVVPPHKLPEPIHVAHRFADKKADEARAAKKAGSSGKAGLRKQCVIVGDDDAKI